MKWYTVKFRINISRLRPLTGRRGHSYVPVEAQTRTFHLTNIVDMVIIITSDLWLTIFVRVVDKIVSVNTKYR